MAKLPQKTTFSWHESQSPTSNSFEINSRRAEDVQRQLTEQSVEREHELSLYPPKNRTESDDELMLLRRFSIHSTSQEGMKPL